jgi:hypothetical protein
LEIGAEAGFDYLRVKAWGMGGVRTRLLEEGALRMSLELRGGAFADAGARHGDPLAQRSAGLALEFGSMLTWKTSWPLAWVGYVRVPLEIPLTAQGVTRVLTMIGGGAEIAITPEHYVLFSGGFGPELRRAALEGTGVRLAVEAMVGVGYRVF